MANTEKKIWDALFKNELIEFGKKHNIANINTMTEGEIISELLKNDSIKVSLFFVKCIKKYCDELVSSNPQSEEYNDALNNLIKSLDNLRKSKS